MKLPLISYWDECELPFLVLVYVLLQSRGRMLSAGLWAARVPFQGAGPAPRPQSCAAFPPACPRPCLHSWDHKLEICSLCALQEQVCFWTLGARVLSAIKMWIPWLKGLMRQPKWEHFQKSDFCNYSGFHQKLLILFLCYRVNLLYNENIVKYTTARSV